MCCPRWWLRGARRVGCVVRVVIFVCSMVFAACSCCVGFACVVRLRSLFVGVRVGGLALFAVSVLVGVVFAIVSRRLAFLVRYCVLLLARVSA